jgi:hypothetical protein
LVAKCKTRGRSTAPGEEAERGGHRGERAAAWSGKKIPSSSDSEDSATRKKTSRRFHARARRSGTAAHNDGEDGDLWQVFLVLLTKPKLPSSKTGGGGG